MPTNDGPVRLPPAAGPFRSFKPTTTTAMSTTATLFCFLLFTRSIFTKGTAATYLPEKAAALPEPSDEEAAPRELPKTTKLGGAPLHILLSERANPGALLRETLLHRPSGRDG